MMQAERTDQRSFSYGQKAIGYDLLISDRKTLKISVYPDQTVVLKAPRPQPGILQPSNLVSSWLAKDKNKTGNQHDLIDETN